MQLTEDILNRMIAKVYARLKENRQYYELDRLMTKPAWDAYQLLLAEKENENDRAQPPEGPGNSPPASGV